MPPARTTRAGALRRRSVLDASAYVPSLVPGFPVSGGLGLLVPLQPAQPAKMKMKVPRYKYIIIFFILIVLVQFLYMCDFCIHIQRDAIHTFECSIITAPVTYIAGFTTFFQR